MSVRSAIILGTCLLGIFLTPGCSKKVTKVAEQPTIATEIIKPVQELERTGSGVQKDINDVLVPVYFDFDQYTLRPGEIAKLERIASFLSGSRNIRLLCEGHCDERGSAEYNMGLGENRAKAIKQWLSAYGIPDWNIETTSFGKERPVDMNCSDDYCHARNRRAEWRVISN